MSQILTAKHAKKYKNNLNRQDAKAPRNTELKLQSNRQERQGGSLSKI
jgi:hypothetical protein